MARFTESEHSYRDPFLHTHTHTQPVKERARESAHSTQYNDEQHHHHHHKEKKKASPHTTETHIGTTIEPLQPHRLNTRTLFRHQQPQHSTITT